MAVINFEVDDSLHKEFKIFCVNNELKIKDALVIAMKILIKKNKRGKKK